MAIDRSLIASTRAAGLLPPPTAMATRWQAPLRAPFLYGDGSMLMLGIQQSFPPGSALEGEARAALEEAKAEAAMLSAHERDLVLRAEKIFVDYADASARSALYRDQKRLLLQLLDTALARFTTGGTALSDITKVQLDAARTEGELAMAIGDRSRAATELNALLGRTSDSPLGPPAEEPPSVPGESSSKTTEIAREHRAEIAAGRAIERREAARGAAAEAAGKTPEFALGLNYGLMRQSGLPDNWGATFLMSLPWLSPAYRARADGGRVRETSTPLTNWLATRT